MGWGVLGGAGVGTAAGVVCVAGPSGRERSARAAAVTATVEAPRAGTSAPPPAGATAPVRRLPAPLPGGTARRSTPTVLTAAGAVLVVLALAFGVVGVLTVRARAGAVDDLAGRDEPLSVAAQEIYRALSDADATATAAFLAGGLEPAAERQRYRSDVAAAEANLSAATANARGSQASLDALARISAALPVYTGLVETARADNRQGLPVGAAYLREASGLMRSTLLPAAAQLYDAESARLRHDEDRASGLPYAQLALGLVLLAVLAVVQRLVFRRTNRLLNAGLVAATAAVLGSLGWVGVALSGASSHLSEARRDGSAQVDVLARARIAALRARSDENLTLVARGGGKVFEDDFAAQLTRLVGTDGRDGRAGDGGLVGQARRQAPDPDWLAVADAAHRDAGAWLAAHKQVRDRDGQGRYTEAVALATGTSPDGEAARFGRLDAGLGRAIRHGQEEFSAGARRAGRSLSGVDVGMGVLALAAAAAVVVGVGQRLREYR